MIAHTSTGNVSAVQEQRAGGWHCNAKLFCWHLSQRSFIRRIQCQRECYIRRKTPSHWHTSGILSFQGLNSLPLSHTYTRTLSLSSNILSSICSSPSHSLPFPLSFPETMGFSRVGNPWSWKCLDLYILHSLSMVSLIGNVYSLHYLH